MNAASDRTIFGRMGRNIAWLLGGRGFQAVTSIAYLAIAARVLHPRGFGEFSLALAYGQAIANLAQFQSWQGVIRYGAHHLERGDDPALSRLLGFTATLDAASALVGALLAAIGVMAVGPLLGWSAVEQHRAALFGVALLLSIGATPNGILRLLDRFDLLAWCQAVGPSVRLAGSVLAWWLGGGIPAFLAVWATAALLQSAVTWGVAIARSPGGFALDRRPLARAIAENEGIIRFMLVTNASSSLSLLIEQIGTLAVGGVAGASAAGGFRLASRLAKALARPVQAIARVLYPELARLLASGERGAIASVMIRTTRIAIMVAFALVVIAGFGGPWMLQWLAGRAYRFAHLYLVLLAVAAAIDLSGFAFEPFLTARGAVGRVLRVRVAAGVAYALALAALLPAIGALGAAIASIAASLVVRVGLGRIVAGAMREDAEFPTGRARAGADTHAASRHDPGNPEVRRARE